MRIAIDGACRRNGKKDCVSSGAAVVLHRDQSGDITKMEILQHTEEFSTNQRGELLALVEALKYILQQPKEPCADAQIITDSEYIFNALTKEWYVSWMHNDWCGSSGAPVKNADIWKRIVELIISIPLDITVFHIKGHCIPFGEVTATNLLIKDSTGEALFEAACNKFEAVKADKVDLLNKAQSLSCTNNGFMLPSDAFKEFIALNTVADAAATVAVNEADRLFRLAHYGP